MDSAIYNIIQERCFKINIIIVIIVIIPLHWEPFQVCFSSIPNIANLTSVLAENKTCVMHIALFHFILMASIHQYDECIKCTKPDTQNIPTVLFQHWHVKHISKMLMSLIWSSGFYLTYIKEIQE